MTAEQLRRAALDGLVVSRPGVRIAEVAFGSMVNLRSADPASVAGVLGAPPPCTPNTVLRAGLRDLLWLGPDEWLVVGPDGDAAGLVGSLRGALGPGRGSAVDVSAHRTTLELSGERARGVLEHGCPVDLHPRAFSPGRCAQTLLARSRVILWQTADTGYRLLVRPSYAGYLVAWLTDAAG